MNNTDPLQEENRKLIDGDENLACSPLDNHIDHIRSHRDILANPDHRVKSEIVKRVVDHMVEHLKTFQESQ